MAFFKFRKSSDAHPAPTPAPESAETLRKRARYRLAGAAFLVLVGVVGFPMLFDNQPRPIAVDIPIEIPDKAKAKPLTAATEPAAASATAPEAAASRAAIGSVATVKEAKPVQKEEVIISSTTSPATKPEPKPESKSATEKPIEKTTPKEAAKEVAKASDATKAQALLDGKAADSKPADKKPAASDAGRFVVQFGAFSDAAKAHEVRMKVEKSGLKTYAQAVQGADGKKFRVRVGPFASRSEAEKAAEKIKKLDLPAAILEL